jgi:hypothetical protein
MQFKLPRPMKFSNGTAVALDYERFTIADAIELTKVADFLDPALLSVYAEKFGKGVTDTGETFSLIKADISESKSQAPASATLLAFVAVRDFKGELIDEKDESLGYQFDHATEGESFPENVIEVDGEAAVKLVYPITLNYSVGAEEMGFKVEWLTFKPQKYKDIAGFLRNYLNGSPRTVLDFIVKFGRMQNIPVDYPLPDGKITEVVANKFDVADGERIAALVMPNFIEMD